MELISLPGFVPYNFLSPAWSWPACSCCGGWPRRSSGHCRPPLAAPLWRVVKIIIARPGPTDDLVRVEHAVSGYSFPSGHVTGYVCFFGFLFFLAWTLPKPGRRRTGAARHRADGGPGRHFAHLRGPALGQRRAGRLWVWASAGWGFASGATGAGRPAPDAPATLAAAGAGCYNGRSPAASGAPGASIRTVTADRPTAVTRRPARVSVLPGEEPIPVPPGLSLCPRRWDGFWICDCNARSMLPILIVLCLILALLLSPASAAAASTRAA